MRFRPKEKVKSNDLLGILMDEQFVPSMDYAICPHCKEKVDLPKDRTLFRLRGKKKQFVCPYCDSPIDYIESGRFIGPPYSME
jgi:transcription initiation factor IIE alpha subunit